MKKIRECKSIHKGRNATKWGREGGCGARGLSLIVLVGRPVGLGGREREARMGESLGWRGKKEDGGEIREKERIKIKEKKSNNILML